MRFKLFSLAAVAALATAMPARADLVYQYYLAPATQPALGAGTNPGPIAPGHAGSEYNPNFTAGAGANANLAVGTPISGTQGSPFVLQPNLDYILQIVLVQTDAAYPNLASSPAGNRLIGYGFRIGGYNASFGPVLPASNFDDGGTADPPYDVNTAGTINQGFGGNPGFSGSNATSIAYRDLTLGNGSFFASGVYPLVNARFRTGSSIAAGRLTITDPGVGNDNGTTNSSNGTTPLMDPLIFDQALVGGAASDGNANGFSLFFSGAAVPEPSSMVLAGLGLAGLGYRRLRRKKVAEEVAAA